MSTLGDETQINAFKSLFPPPVLSTEDKKSFEQILDKVTECVAPQNIIEWMCVRHYVCASWYIERYMRHSTLVIERHVLEQRESPTQRVRRRGAATEREHNYALQKSVVFQEQLNALIVHQMAIRNGALQQLELYRVGLGQLTKDVTRKTIEAKCKEINEPRLTEAPSIAPAQESTEHGLPTPDRSE
jgi:hypothetical protein